MACSIVAARVAAAGPHACHETNVPAVGLSRCHHFGTWSDDYPTLWIELDATEVRRGGQWDTEGSFRGLFGFLHWFYAGDEFGSGVAFTHLGLVAGVRHYIGPLTAHAELEGGIAVQWTTPDSVDRFSLSARARVDVPLSHAITVGVAIGTGIADPRERIVGLSLGLHPAF